MRRTLTTEVKIALLNPELTRDPAQRHLHYKLKLRDISLNLHTSYARPTLQSLSEARKDVIDKQELAHIYSRMGILWKRIGREEILHPEPVHDWLRGTYWCIRALMVPGVPLNSRKKALATLLGIER